MSSDAKPRVLILSAASIGEEMAGVAIRAVEIARALRAVADVRIAAATVTGDPGIGVPLGTWSKHDPRSVRPHLRDVDVVIAQPQWPLVARELRRCGARLIYELGIPEPLEVLETHRARPLWLRRLLSAFTGDRFVTALRDGDHILASTETQHDLWLGTMLGERLLGPARYDPDPGFARRLVLVPHGISDEPPERSDGPGLRGAFEAIEDGDELILWNSAIWRWFDAETAIRGVAELAARRPTVKLIFMSRAEGEPEHVQPIGAARALARELGVLDTHVLFNDGWVPYSERADWLLDADVALACHRPHLETRFAFRTRYLDCLWAGLPLVVTDGDDLARRIAQEDLGVAVPSEDPTAVAGALEAVLGRGRADYAARLARAADDYRWARAATPLRELLTAPVPEARLGAGVPRRPAHMLRDLSYGAGAMVLRILGRDRPARITR